ncbi:hypothetical protein CKA32_002216 [Geitlerinema sp. FC II]|nr:hypothetical protein CKA32_002216 [Geitlerinema sp. FC II]
MLLGLTGAILGAIALLKLRNRRVEVLHRVFKKLEIAVVFFTEIRAIARLTT